MISRIHGLLESLTGAVASIDPGAGLTYSVYVPAFTAARLGMSIGQPITLHTIHYLEGAAQGSSFVPRLAGFVTESDRAFFELFTSVKGIGPRKALRAMAMPSAQIAAAIADRDVKTLQALPEVGKRTAETIVASLHDRVDRFIDEKSFRAADQTQSAPTPSRSAAREALEVLVQLGENRTQAITWIDDVLAKRPDIDDAQVVITEVLRLKSGV
ncbi:MAG: hypothetical protein GC162_11035 [Planctomycetes bacterium]|nr:hypothetical protein [Planctomycetota bacterium]